MKLSILYYKITLLISEYGCRTEGEKGLNGLNKAI